MSNDIPLLSLIIPFFNDQDRLLKRLKDVEAYFKARPYLCEVILVDDGSMQDRSSEIKALYPFVKIVRYVPNRGKGFAVKTGMLAARGSYRFFTDADIPFGLDPLESGLRRLQAHECDLVVGDRHHPLSVCEVDQSPLRRFASKIFARMVQKLFTLGIRDTQCGLKGFCAKSAQALFERSRIRRFAFDVEILYMAVEEQLRIGTLPVVLKHSAGSTLKLSFDAAYTFYELLKIRWRGPKGRVSGFSSDKGMGLHS